MRRPSLTSVILAVLWAVAVAVVGGIFTDMSVWYHALQKPSWQPPAWILGPVWSTLYLLSAIAAVTAANAPIADRGTRTDLALAYLVNGFLNVLWTYLFFRCQRPDWAMIELPVLWLSIGWMMWTAGRVSGMAVWLLAPYLGWVAFAGAVNWAIVRMN